MKAQANADLRADPQYLKSKIRNIDDAELFASLDGVTTCEAWAKHWNTVAPAREKFGDVDEFLTSRAQATQSIINGKDAIIALAERVLKHDIQGWGPTSIQHGPVVDFNADYGQSGKYGFHYWGFARPLIQAFLVTQDQKYLDEFELLFNQWYEQRDKIVGGFPNLDVVYYELGLGVRNRIFLEYYFLPHAKRSTQTHQRMLKTFLGAARWLHEEEKLAYRAHNWQMIGSFGLAQLGLILPEFREARSWVTLGAQRTLEHLQQDFFPDGCFSERCPSSYNIIAYRDPRNLATLLESNPAYRDLATQIHQPLFAQVDFLTHVVAPDGYLSGVNDGARAPLLKTIAELRPPKSEPSRHFAPSGFTVFRCDFTPNARYMLINHGPAAGGHSHADALSFELHAFGQALAIDCGIGDTYDDPLWSSWYVHAVAHNMLTIDGEDPDRSAGAGTDVTWTSNDRFDHFAATHRGYEKSKGIIHRRHILFVKPDYFLVYDSIDARAATKECTLQWNLHPTIPLDKSSGPGLIVLPSAPWTKHSETAWASVAGIRGYEGKNQAQIEWLRFAHKISPGTTTQFAVLLYPFATSRPHVRFTCADSDSLEVEHPNGVDVIRFKPNDVALDMKRN